MADGHGRYEELAVGHVLGGLTPEQSAAFRSHLHTCPECRSRVAELHGIADDLAAAARDERARTPVQTEVTRRVEPEQPAPRPPRIRVGHVTAAVVVVLALATAMAFWNLHLRSAAATYLGVAEAQGDALARLATGVELEPVFSSGVQGRVVTDGTAVTLTLAGLEALGDEGRPGGGSRWGSAARCASKAAKASSRNTEAATPTSWGYPSSGCCYFYSSWMCDETKASPAKGRLCERTLSG